MQKILAIQFKYLGDAVLLTPALKALHQHYPDAEIHVLVAAEVAPVLSHLPFIKKTWAFPRSRGKLNLKNTLPFIKALKKQKFNLTIDFAGNDRGAILSYLIHARSRLGLIEGRSKFVHKIAYTSSVSTDLLSYVWVDRYLEMLCTLLRMPKPAEKTLEIHSNPALAPEAKKMMGGNTVIFHVGTSEQKKEWPIPYWLSLYQTAKESGYHIAFSAGHNERELNLLQELKSAQPEAFIIHPCKNLELFIAVLDQAEIVISGDTGPLHFAAGLHKKIIGLFGVADGVKFYAPAYQKEDVLIGNKCTCTGELNQFKSCQSAAPCMASISADQVFELLKKKYPVPLSISKP